MTTGACWWSLGISQLSQLFAGRSVVPVSGLGLVGELRCRPVPAALPRADPQLPGLGGSVPGAKPGASAMPRHPLRLVWK